MNHTHYILVNEDHNPVAVIRRDTTKFGVNESALKTAIQEELDADIIGISITDTDYMNFKVQGRTDEDFEFTFMLRPTWEY